MSKPEKHSLNERSRYKNQAKESLQFHSLHALYTPHMLNVTDTGVVEDLRQPFIGDSHILSRIEHTNK